MGVDGMLSEEELEVLATGSDEAVEAVLGELSGEGLVDAWLALADQLELIKAAAARLGRYAGELLDRPVVAADGRIVKPDRPAPTWSQWDKPKLWTLVTEACGRKLVDPESGQLVDALDPVLTAKYVDIATSRGRAMRELVGDLTEVATRTTPPPKLAVVS